MQGAKILELGSGTGWLGCTLARNLPEAEMIQLTDLPVVLDELLPYCNNFAEEHLARNNLFVCSCNWKDYTLPGAPAIWPNGKGEDNAATTGWDVIVGSDLVWNNATVKGLPFAISAALRGGKPGCMAYYAHWQRNLWALPLLLEGFHSLGLCTEWVNEPPATTKKSETVEIDMMTPLETEDGLDWTSVIFCEEEEVVPIMQIHKIWLASDTTPTVSPDVSKLAMPNLPEGVTAGASGEEHGNFCKQASNNCGIEVPSVLEGGMTGSSGKEPGNSFKQPSNNCGVEAAN